MQIAVISDIHDNLWNLAAALEEIAAADVLICCGDLCSPFVIDQLAKFAGPIHIVFGNNDADLFRITSKSASKSNINVHGELFRAEFDGRRFAVNHFDYIARPMAKSGDFDVVCFGHNHEFELSTEGACQLVNPGPIMGAKFSNGWEDVPATYVVYDTVSGRPARHSVTRSPVTL